MSLMADEELSSKESAESPVQLPSALVLAVEKPSLADCAVSETDFHPLDAAVRAPASALSCQSPKLI